MRGWCGGVGECARVFFVVDRRSWCVGCIARICCFGRGMPGVFSGCARVGCARRVWWACARARVLLRVFGWVGDVECVAFAEELFCL